MHLGQMPPPPYFLQSPIIFFRHLLRCAELWRELQLREDDEGRKERNREMDLVERELEIKNRQLEMERQKVTIKETLPNGSMVELTCFYDDKMQEKVRSLLKGKLKRGVPSK